MSICAQDEKIQIHRAKEPSVYIWENLAVPRETQSQRKCIAIIILIILMLVAYYFQFAMSAADANFDVFEDIDCDGYKAKLLSDAGNDQSKADDEFSKNAYDAWHHHYVEGGGEKTKYVDGTLGCFCDDQYKMTSGIALYFKYFEVGEKFGPICSEYVKYDKWAPYFHILLAISIIIINAIFYAIIVPLVQWIGYHRRTFEVLMTCNLIVVSYFMDMVLLPIMVHANFQEF